jgi:hypothetical protein
LSAGSTDISIGQLRNTYLVPKEHPSPEDLRRRLDDVARTRLPAVCDRLLVRTLDPDDPSVWLIRRLEVALAADVDAQDGERLALAWGGRIATVFARTLARGADGENVLCFPDATAYLVQFVADLAAGSAWDRWYYTHFDSLRSLPTSAAIREALTREPGGTGPAIEALAARGSLEQVLSALSPTDAQHVYDACIGLQVTPETRLREAIDALVAVWPLVAPHGGQATAHNTLRLYAAVCRSAPTVLESGLRHAITAVLSFAEALHQINAPMALVRLLAAGQMRAAIKLARSAGVSEHIESLPLLAQVAAGNEAWLTQVAWTIRSTAGEAPGSLSAASATHVRATPFAGIFLLLPSIANLDLPRVFAAASSSVPDVAMSARVLGYVLALKCLGRPLVREALYDPALHLAAGLDDPPTSEDCLRVTGAANADGHERYLRALLGHLFDQGRVAGRWLAGELVTTPSGAEALLLRDIEHDTWVYADAAGDSDRTKAALEQGVYLVQTATGVSIEFLLVGTSLRDRLDLNTPGAWADRVIVLDTDLGHGMPSLAASAGEATVPEELRLALARHRARARPPSAELTYLSLADLVPPVCASVSFDLAWSVIAHAVLRDFAGRLMGFSSSSAEYLYANFLAGTGSIRLERDHIDVQLPHSPLHLILRMAGVDGRTYPHPWLSGTQVTLWLGTE